MANFRGVVTDAMKAARDAAIGRLPAAANTVKATALAVKDTAVAKLPATADVAKAAALAAKDMAVDKLPAVGDAVKATAVAVKDAAMEKLPAAADAVNKLFADSVASGTMRSLAKYSKPWLAMALQFLQEGFVRLVTKHAIAVLQFRIAAAAAAAAATGKTARAILKTTRTWLARFLLEDLARWARQREVTVRKFLAAASPGAAPAAIARTASRASKIFVAVVRRHRVVVGMLLMLPFREALPWMFKIMKAPGMAGMLIPRLLFEANPRLYFALLRNWGIVSRTTACAAAAPPMPVLLIAGAAVCLVCLIAATMLHAYKMKMNSAL